MNVVCKKCKRVLVNNQWLMDVPPIGKASYTICPYCMDKKKDEKKPTKGMVYQDQIREKEKVR